jgi:hypothetical protein
MWAVGVFGQGGFEKLVELNPQHKDFVIIAPSGMYLLMLSVPMFVCLNSHDILVS